MRWSSAVEFLRAFAPLDGLFPELLFLARLPCTRNETRRPTSISPQPYLGRQTLAFREHSDKKSWYSPAQKTPRFLPAWICKYQVLSLKSASSQKDLTATSHIPIPRL